METIHGYMFDKNTFLGAGFGGFVFPNSQHPTFMNAFVDYHCYFRDKNSLFLGVKAGWAHAFDYEKNNDIKFKNGALLEPNVGWSWLLKSGKGLDIGLGITAVVPVGDSRTDWKILPLPKISIGLEF